VGLRHCPHFGVHERAHFSILVLGVAMSRYILVFSTAIHLERLELEAAKAREDLSVAIVTQLAVNPALRAAHRKVIQVEQEIIEVKRCLRNEGRN
jgi:hypothetical protein